MPPAMLARLGVVRSFQISAVFPSQDYKPNPMSFTFDKSGNYEDLSGEKNLLLKEYMINTSRATWLF